MTPRMGGVRRASDVGERGDERAEEPKAKDLEPKGELWRLWAALG